MKIFISADIEGVNGILDFEEASIGNKRFDAIQKQMTAEVRAACIGAHLAGAKEVIIKDAHASAANLSITDFPDYVKLIRGWSGHPFMMMYGLDASFDAAIMIGYHSKTRSGGNPLSHTISGAKFHSITINGEIMSEFMVNAYTAAYVGVPVVFLSGDVNLCKEVKKVNSHIETVETNEGVGNSICCTHPSIINEKITTQVKKVLSNELSRCHIELPNEFVVDIAYKKHYDAYRASFFPGVQLINDDTIRFVTKDYFEVLRLLHFV